MTTLGLPFFSSCVLGSMPLQHSHAQASVRSCWTQSLTAEQFSVSLQILPDSPRLPCSDSHLSSMLTISSYTAFSMRRRTFRPAGTSAMLTRFFTLLRSPMTSFTLTSACDRSGDVWERVH